MRTNSLVLGIDLGTTGLRIAIINTKKEILYTSARTYSTGLETWEDWISVSYTHLTLPTILLV